MNIAVVPWMLLALAVAGCSTPTRGPLPVGDRDDLIGWYSLPVHPNRSRKAVSASESLIPVLKRETGYYSVCRGVEVPLKVCPEGLEWGFSNSSMAGTRIGLDEATRKPYIVIEDAKAQYEAGLSLSGQKQYLTPTSQPPGFREPTASPPRTLDDCLGCYQPVWFPVFRWNVRKVGNQYRLEGEVATPKGWTQELRESAALEPLPDRLGFAWGPNGETRLEYNGALGRYECVSAEGLVRMPLERVKASRPPKTGVGSASAPIGIPSWH